MSHQFSDYDLWKTTEPPDWRDEQDYCPECQHLWARCKCEPDEPEPPEQDEVGCCFPGRCCMPGEHLVSECHTIEMMEQMIEDGEA